MIDHLGASDHSAVYRARDIDSGEEVALKVIPSAKGTNRRSALGEVSLLLSFDHINLVRCLNVYYLSEGSFAIAYEYIPGGNLRKRIEEGPPFSLQQWCDCAIQLFHGVGHLHEHGVLHCDLKPENILVVDDGDGSKRIYKIADLGVARKHDPRDLISSQGMGSPAYMAPEAFNGRATFSSDIYSLGIILYELITGDRPFHGNVRSLAQLHSHEQPDLSSIPWTGIRAILGMLLQKKEGNRLNDSSAIIQIIESLSVNPDVAEVDLPEPKPNFFNSDSTADVIVAAAGLEFVNYELVGHFQTEIPFTVFEPVVLSNRAHILIGDSNRLHLYGGERLRAKNIFYVTKDRPVQILKNHGFVTSSASHLELWNSDDFNPTHIETLGLQATCNTLNQANGSIAWCESGKLLVRKWGGGPKRQSSSTIDRSSEVLCVNFWCDRIVLIQGILNPKLSFYDANCKLEKVITLPGPLIEISYLGFPGFLCWDNRADSYQASCLVIIDETLELVYISLNKEQLAFNRFSTFGALLTTEDNTCVLYNNMGERREVGQSVSGSSKHFTYSPDGKFYYAYNEGIEDSRVSIYRRKRE